MKFSWNQLAHPNWVEGNIGKHGFQAKVYDEGSDFGIDDGRVSKLSISGVCNYDRGWDEQPKDVYGWGVLNETVNQLEEIPSMDERTNHKWAGRTSIPFSEIYGRE
jgi:hypothetical protein